MADDGNPDDPVGREDEDVVAVVFSAELRAGQTVPLERSRLPGLPRPLDLPASEPTDDPRPWPREIANPKVSTWLKDPADVLEIFIVLVDPIGIPRFPEPATDQRRSSAANRIVLERADELVRSITARRAPGFVELERALVDFDSTIVERFWLVNGVVAEVPRGSVDKLATYLAQRPDVVSIGPRFASKGRAIHRAGGGQLSTHPESGSDGSDPSGWMGLLDTGVRATHQLLDKPSRIGLRRDCVDGGPDGATGPELDTGDCEDHGTPSAAIIVGNASQGAELRGITEMSLNSYRVYRMAHDHDGTYPRLDRVAALRALQQAVRLLDRVIVAEIQAKADHLHALAMAADAAFDAGAVVIAANGNSGPTKGTVRCPANAHKVIGVGAVDAATGERDHQQSEGPTIDDRVKPDIQAATGLETATGLSDSDTRVFGDTSAAAAHAGGAAALLRQWLRDTSSSIDPGQVYVLMMLCGRNPDVDNDDGAGALGPLSEGRVYWGKIRVSHRAFVDVPISVDHAAVRRADAAIWWPEPAIHSPSGLVDPHADLDLSLVDPAGHTRTSSAKPGSVYQRCRVTDSVGPGRWHLRVTAQLLPTGPQTVYWAAHVGGAEARPVGPAARFSWPWATPARPPEPAAPRRSGPEPPA